MRSPRWASRRVPGSQVGAAGFLACAFVFVACGSADEEAAPTPRRPKPSSSSKGGASGQPAGAAGRASDDGGASGQGGRGAEGGTTAGVAGKAGEAGGGGKNGASGQGGFASSAGTAGGSPDEGPCKGVPPGGLCLGLGTVRRCVRTTGSAKPKIVDETCAPYHACTTEEGTSACRLKPAKCAPESSECVGIDERRLCNGDGDWETGPCPSCAPGPTGVVCGTVSGGTKSFQLHVTYQGKGPNADYTDWDSKLYEAPLSDALVVSYRKEGTALVAIDSALLDEKGDVTLQIPSAPGPGDAIFVFAIRPTEDGTSTQFGIYEPEVGDGVQDVGTPIAAGRPWSWGFDLTGSLGSSAGLSISPEQGSGVLRVFDYLRYTYNSTSQLLQAPGKPLVIWMRNGTSWSCGACADSYSASFDSFKAQIWYPMLASDEEYWSDAVTAHELGHWMMGSYSQLSYEGGTHYASCPGPPGLAWNEGWATYFSSIARNDARYYDKIDGFFFSFDIDARSYSSGAPWTRPVASAGLLQSLDENEVASMLWTMATKVPIDADMLEPNLVYLQAMASPRSAAALRGYTARSFDMNEDCSLSNVTDTGYPSTCLADYLDALICGGVSAATVDAATAPAERYPYPSQSPVCP